MLSESPGLMRQDAFVEGKIRVEILEVTSCGVVTYLQFFGYADDFLSDQTT